MDIKITKRTLLREVNNDMCHNWYWLVQGKIYSDDKKWSRKFKFIEWFDAFDVQEYAEDGTHSKENVLEFLGVLIDSRLSIIKSFDDCQDFYNECNRSINWWNKKMEEERGCRCY